MALYSYITVFWNVPLSLLLLTHVFSFLTSIDTSRYSRFSALTLRWHFFLTRFMRRSRVWGQPPPPTLHPENNLKTTCGPQWPPMAPNNLVNTKVWPPSSALHIKNLPTPVLVAICLEKSIFRLCCQVVQDWFVQSRVMQGRVIKDRFSQGVIFESRIIMGQIVQKRIVQNRVPGSNGQGRCIWQRV